VILEAARALPAALPVFQGRRMERLISWAKAPARLAGIHQLAEVGRAGKAVLAESPAPPCEHLAALSPGPAAVALPRWTMYYAGRNGGARPSADSSWGYKTQAEHGCGKGTQAGSRASLCTS